MRFLITGGAGFIGAALANRLVEMGHEVRVLDDLSAGDRDRLAEKVHFTKGDINDVPTLWSMLEGVDCVFHLAARVSVAQSILYPREYNAINVGGTVSLMEATRDAGIGRVVLASSGAVYGGQRNQPVSETDTPSPDSPYAVSKWAAEQYIHTIGHLWGIETVALRIFNAYGPGQSLPASHAPVVPRFFKAITSGGSVVIYGDGEQSRDFVFIGDVVEMMISAATARNIDRQVINVGSGKEVTVNQLLRQIERVTGLEAHCVWNRDKDGGVRRLVADTAKARKLLAFSELTSLEGGLRATLEGDPRFCANEERL